MIALLVAGFIAQAPADITYCPADHSWSATWHYCPPLPTCQYEDGSYGTECLWSVEVDGRVQLVGSCANEDGNVDGKPCLWADPDTGNRYYVTSDNYRMGA